MGVGHVAAVSASAQCDGQPARAGHDWAACWEFEPGLLCGTEHGELVEEDKLGCDWVGERERARLKPRADFVLGMGKARGHCVRANDVGGGHVDSMPDWAWGARESAHVADDGREVRELEPGSVGRGRHDERDAERELSGHRVFEHYTARGEHGARSVHADGGRRAYWQRAVDVGV